MANPKVWLEDDGIVRVEYEPFCSLNLDVIKHVNAKRIALHPIKHPLLMKLNGLNSFEKDAQQYIKSSLYNSITSATAIYVPYSVKFRILTTSLVQNFVNDNLFMPLQLFDNEIKALSWLAQYI